MSVFWSSRSSLYFVEIGALLITDYNPLQEILLYPISSKEQKSCYPSCDAQRTTFSVNPIMQVNRETAQVSSHP